MRRQQKLGARSALGVGRLHSSTSRRRRARSSNLGRCLLGSQLHGPQRNSALRAITIQHLRQTVGAFGVEANDAAFGELGHASKWTIAFSQLRDGPQLNRTSRRYSGEAARGRLYSHQRCIGDAPIALMIRSCFFLSQKTKRPCTKLQRNLNSKHVLGLIVCVTVALQPVPSLEFRKRRSRHEDVGKFGKVLHCSKNDTCVKHTTSPRAVAITFPSSCPVEFTNTIDMASCCPLSQRETSLPNSSSPVYMPRRLRDRVVSPAHPPRSFARVGHMGT